MEYDRRPNHSNMNGLHRTPPEVPCGADKKRRNYKLIVDPQIHIYKGNQKIYRFDGVSPDGTVVEAKDPRLQRIWYRRQPADLPVPQFKYDQYYVGTPPPKEVTFTNLNDNINKDFLENMCKGYGKIEEVRIYYNPKNRKHLGVGKVVYSSSKAAKLCAEKLNRTSKMGNIMNVFVDTLGKERQRIIEEKLVERARIELPNNKRDRNNGFGAGNSTEAYDPDDFEYGGGSLQSQFSYPPSESGFGSHSSDMGFSSGTPYSQATFTPGSMYGGDMQGSGYTPASEMNYGMHHHQPHHHHQQHHHHHHHHHQQQQPPHTPYSMPPPPHQPPPHFNNSFVNFDPKVPPPPLPSEPPPLTPSGHYQQHAIKTPSDHGHHERSRSREADPDWHRSKHHDRDCEIDKDLEWEREKDKERERHRDRDRDRDRDRKHKGRDGNGVVGCSSRADSSERPHSLPKPPADKHARPKTPDDEPEEEPRFMSLESRIQSLLRGSASLEDDPLPQPVSRPQEHPLATPGTPHTPSTPSDMRQFNDSSNSSFNNGGWVAQGAGDAAQQTPVPPEADKDDGSDMDVVDDDDDRMSLSSISSGEERLQVNQPITSNLSSSGMSLGLFTQPPPIGLWQTSGAPFEFNSFGGKNFLGNSGPFNQGFSGAPFPNGVVDQTAHLQADFAAKEEEHKKIDKQFVYVLNQFVNELKAVMQKDLCKKMVENSAFKAFESWWDGEEQKSKVPSKAIMPLADKAIEKPTKPLVPNATEGISSTIASLFDSRHPWTKEGGLESGFGFSVFGSGGLLGIRGSMPRLPSFKKKFRPPSPPVDESAVQHKLDKTQDAAEAESDVDQETSQSPKPPASRRVIYSSDSDEESDDDKEVSAVEDEEEEDEEEEEEEEESGVSEEDSEEEDEDDDDEEEEEESDLSAAESEDEEGAKIRTKATGEVEDAEDESLDADRSEIDEEKEEDESDDADSEADLATDRHKKEDLHSAKTGAREKKVLVNRDSQKDLESKPKETSSPSVKEKDDNFVQEQAGKNKEDNQSRDSAEEEEEDIDIEELENSDNRDSKHVVAEAAEELAEISRSHVISEGIKLLDKKRADECQEKKSSDETNNVPARFPSDISISPLVKSQETVLANTVSDDKLASVKMLGIPEPTVHPKEVKPVETSSSTMDIVMKEEEVSVSVDEEEEESRPYIIPAIAEHDYFAVPPSGPVPATMTDPEDTDSAEEDINSYCQEVWMEHSYSLPIMKQEDFDADASLSTQDLSADAAKSPKVKKAKKPEPFVAEEAPVSEPALKKGKTKKDKVSEDRDVPEKKQRKVKKDKLVDITNKGVRELAQLLPEPVVPKPPVTFEIRNMQEEREVFFDIYHRGIDEEDITYLKRTYDELMLSEDPMFYWLNDILWVDHPFTNIPDPPRKRHKVEDSYQNRPHRTGSARTDGYYKLTLEEKARYLSHARNVTLQQKAAETLNENLDESKKKAQTSREVRSETRRLQSTFSEYLDMGDLFKFNQLKTRKKLLRFAKSGIHDWGLFALEPIAADEMVIEYVGSVVRQSVAELREKQYERSGIGSSYLFRVDHETIIDATMNGNLARFINHSCNPNCYAKVITMESQKKIVIYSKRDIDVNEEITYDYKFPIEDEKIPCLCGAPNCRGTLN